MSLIPVSLHLTQLCQLRDPKNRNWPAIGNKKVVIKVLRDEKNYEGSVPDVVKEGEDRFLKKSLEIPELARPNNGLVGSSDRKSG